MLEFFIGLGAGLVVALWVNHRADLARISLNKSIHAGLAVPDESGNIGWVIK